MMVVEDDDNHSLVAFFPLMRSETTSAVEALGNLLYSSHRRLVDRIMDIGDNMLDEIELLTLPPLSPTMERAFSEALEDLSEMEKSEDPTVSLRMATPPPSRNQQGDMSPNDKNQDSAEAKRARRSTIEKKSRQRRQEMLQRMREEVKQLEQVYSKMATRSERVYTFESMDELQRKYSELSLVAHVLEEDQAALRELTQRHELFQYAMKTFTDEKEAEQALWNTGIPPSSSFAVPFRQHSADECFAIVREAYQEIERFCQADSFESSGANFMGWTDKRKVDHELESLQFCFTKRFPIESAEHLLNKTWNIFSNGTKMAEMAFDSSVRTRFEVLQVLNDNLIIIRRDHKIPSMPMTFASVQLIFRLQTPTGYTMCSCTIPVPEIQKAMEPHEYYYDAFHWTRFNHLYDEIGNPAGCEIVAGGSVKDQNQLQSRYWLFELICSVLRWEHACVAPLLLKQL